MENIKESVRILFENKHHHDVVEKFARQAYEEKFKDMKQQDGAYHGYDDFVIIDKDTIRVIYVFGATSGDFDYREFFDVKVD